MSRIGYKWHEIGLRNAVFPSTAPFDAASAAKGYPSLSANLVNHPNDFMIRVYAASIVQALLDAGTELVQ